MTAGPKFDLQGKRIFVAGHRGMVGSAVLRRLALDVAVTGRPRVVVAMA